MTLLTLESFIIIFFKKKHIITVCCWTPRSKIIKMFTLNHHVAMHMLLMYAIDICYSIQ
jgi:hypothetical protein